MLNFNISVGVTVPSTVRVHPLPTRVIEIYPEWRGYDFIPGQWSLRYPSTADARDRLHHRRLGPAPPCGARHSFLVHSTAPGPHPRAVFLALCGSMQLQRNDCHFIPLASRLNKGA